MNVSREQLLGPEGRSLSLSGGILRTHQSHNVDTVTVLSGFGPKPVRVERWGSSSSYCVRSHLLLLGLDGLEGLERFN